VQIEQFAEQYRLRVKRDSCGEKIVSGKFRAGRGRPEDHSHIFENGDDQFGLCLLFATARKFGSVMRKLLAAGFTLGQIGDTEGTFLFDPANTRQAKLAIRVVGTRQKRILSPEQLAQLSEIRLERFRPAEKGPSSPVLAPSGLSKGSEAI